MQLLTYGSAHDHIFELHHSISYHLWLLQNIIILSLIEIEQFWYLLLGMFRSSLRGISKTWHISVSKNYINYKYIFMFLQNNSINDIASICDQLCQIWKFVMLNVVIWEKCDGYVYLSTVSIDRCCLISKENTIVKQISLTKPMLEYSQFDTLEQTSMKF